MTRDEVMSRLNALADAQTHKRNEKIGLAPGHIGVKSGDLRNLAKEIKKDQDLALELWNSGQHESMLLACLVLNPKKFSVEQVDAMAHQLPSWPVTDSFNTSISKLHPQKETLREMWMKSDVDLVRRSGWSLTTERVLKNPEGLDLSALLDQIEAEMGSKSKNIQWTMNYCLASIGIEFPEHRGRAIAIGEKIGAFKDFPTSKGCVSPYAPSWITEMVRRSG